MNTFDQKRADRDAVLYNTDGRHYDLEEHEGRLEIVARPTASVLWVWTTMASILAAYCVILLIPPGALPYWQRYSLMFAVAWISQEILQRIAQHQKFLEPKRWIADKSTGQFCADAKQIARLEEIVAVRGRKSRWEIPWRTPKRFRLSVQLHDGRQIRLGLWTFASREYAWRQDAAQIARFLNVPLEIPPF